MKKVVNLITLGFTGRYHNINPEDMEKRCNAMIDILESCDHHKGHFQQKVRWANVLLGKLYDAPLKNKLQHTIDKESERRGL